MKLREWPSHAPTTTHLLSVIHQLRIRTSAGPVAAWAVMQSTNLHDGLKVEGGAIPQGELAAAGGGQ